MFFLPPGGVFGCSSAAELLLMFVFATRWSFWMLLCIGTFIDVFFLPLGGAFGCCSASEPLLMFVFVTRWSCWMLLCS